MNETKSNAGMKKWISLVTERGFVTRAEIVAYMESAETQRVAVLPKYSYPNKVTKVDAEIVDAIVETFREIGIEVRAD